MDKKGKVQSLTDKFDSEINQTSESNCLIQGDASRYYKKYVAEPSFSDRRVVAFGKNPIKVIKKARQRGYEHPVIFYVPHPETILIY
jgi:hypothetical protein